MVLLLSTDEWCSMREIFYVFTTIYCFLYTFIFLTHWKWRGREKIYKKWCEKIIDLCKWGFDLEKNKIKEKKMYPLISIYAYTYYGQIRQIFFSLSLLLKILLSFISWKNDYFCLFFFAIEKDVMEKTIFSTSPFLSLSFYLLCSLLTCEMNFPKEKSLNSSFFPPHPHSCYLDFVAVDFISY